ncbi:tyrosine-type recombinase/integrase [Clostridium akagii]|uniref:tyrosine-type recombinase/integrase n=1 Tax=Clostridium akagii TaxID=91623 RepID=UPI00047E9990|nr:site-specific integrase [Clostridium akagii]
MSNSGNNKIKYLTQNETTRLFNAIINYESCHSIRDLALFRVAYRCGLRASEIGMLNIDDYNTIRGDMYCKRLKGSNNNTIRLDEKTKIALDTYLSESALGISQRYIFQSQKNNPISRQTLDYLMKKYCSLAKIEDRSKHHFHALKHTTAVHLAESDMDIKELQWWLGHKSVSNTEVYFQFTTKQQETMYAKLACSSELV